MWKFLHFVLKFIITKPLCYIKRDFVESLFLGKKAVPTGVIRGCSCCRCEVRTVTAASCLQPFDGSLLCNLVREHRYLRNSRSVCLVCTLACSRQARFLHIKSKGVPEVTLKINSRESREFDKQIGLCRLLCWHFRSWKLCSERTSNAEGWSPELSDWR